jgi:DNA-binding transcriptional LysR family regulator
MDRLKALEIFKAVVDHGSFVKASDALNLSKPAVTRAIQELEAVLGVQLLLRTTRRISLTAVGHQVLLHTASLLQCYEAMAEASSLNSTEIAGDIKLIAPVSYGMRRLGPALAEFMAAHPKVRVDLRLADGPAALLENHADLALCVAGSLSPSLIARRVSSVHVGLFASPVYLARRGTPQHPLDLLEHDCLIHDGAAGSQWTLVNDISEERIPVAVRGTLNSNNGDALVGAAIHGAGLVRLPDFYVDSAVARGELVQVLEDWTCPAVDLSLAYVSRQHQPLRVRKLIEHLATALGDVPQFQAPRAARTECSPVLTPSSATRPVWHANAMPQHQLAA